MTSHPSYEQSKQVAEAGRETEWTRPSFGKSSSSATSVWS